jgi:hypothetical protein
LDGSPLCTVEEEKKRLGKNFPFSAILGVCWTYTPVGWGGGVHPEVGKVVLKSYSDEAFKDEFLLKSHCHEALSKDSL